MAGHSHDKPFTYEDELHLVQALIAEGDRKHALHHCLGALALEPHRGEWQPLLEDLLSSPDRVTDLEEDGYYAAKAALAWHWHESGQRDDALELIGAVAAAVPHAGFHRWFAEWLPGGTVAPETAIRVLMLGLTFGIGRIRLLPGERAAANELVPIARFCVETVRDPQIAMLASSVVRRAGEYVEAIALAEAGGTDPKLATPLGLAQRAAGLYADAVRTFDRAYEQSGDVTFWQEKFRVLVDAGQWAEADDLAAEIQKHKAVDDENEREYWYAADARKANAPVPAVPPLDRIRRVSLGHDWLAPMIDASANGIRQYLEEHGPPTEAVPVEIAVTGHECPSSRLAIALTFAQSNDPRTVTYKNTDVMRMLDDETDAYTVWKLDGDVAVPALAAPPSAVLDWVDGMCRGDDAGFLALWDTASSSTRPDATARDWVAATVYPGHDAEEAGPDWVYRWQTIALIGLAFSDPGWAGTRKRDAFLSLLRGVIDWTTAAAIRVVTEIALQDPAALPEIRRTLIGLVEPLSNMPNAGVPQTLLVCLQMVPLVGKHFIDTLRATFEPRED